MTNLFSKKIICLRCKKRYKYKLEYGKPHYICAGYSNFGKQYCERQGISQIELVFLIEKHMDIQKIKKEDISIRDYVDRIEKDGEEFVIYYTDETETIVSNNRIKY